MKTVYLTSGPRGSGKSAYCERFVKLHPEIPLISRDKILVELFGSAMIDSETAYAGGHYYAIEKMFERMGEALSGENDIIILDSWNGDLHERRIIMGELKQLGVEEVACLQFFTPFEKCWRWCNGKYNGREGNEAKNMFKKDYDNYYKYAKDIGEVGFDAIYRIDVTNKQHADFLELAKFESPA